jgi:hypothetical protein
LVLAAVGIDPVSSWDAEVGARCVTFNTGAAAENPIGRLLQHY